MRVAQPDICYCDLCGKHVPHFARYGETVGTQASIIIKKDGGQMNTITENKTELCIECNEAIIETYNRFNRLYVLKQK